MEGSSCRRCFNAQCDRLYACLTEARARKVRGRRRTREDQAKDLNMIRRTGLQSIGCDQTPNIATIASSCLAGGGGGGSSRPSLQSTDVVKLKVNSNVGSLLPPDRCNWESPSEPLLFLVTFKMYLYI